MTSSVAPTDWFVLRADQQHGPFSDAEMNAAAEGGHLEPDDHVWRAGLAEWQPAGSVFKLAGEAVHEASEAVSQSAVVTPAPAAATLPTP